MVVLGGRRFLMREVPLQLLKPVRPWIRVFSLSTFLLTVGDLNSLDLQSGSDPGFKDHTWVPRS
jgi:hypothetical protein